LPVENKPSKKPFYLHHQQGNHPGMKAKRSCFPALLAGKLQRFCCCSEVPQATRQTALGVFPLVRLIPLAASVFQNTKEQGKWWGSNRAGTVAGGISLPSSSEEHRAPQRETGENGEEVNPEPALSG